MYVTCQGIITNYMGTVKDIGPATWINPIDWFSVPMRIPFQKMGITITSGWRYWGLRLRK